MSTPHSGTPNVAQIAARILIAWKSGRDSSLDHERANVRVLTTQFGDNDTFERERLEVLEGVLHFLTSAQHHRTRAAEKLLEHLAKA